MIRVSRGERWLASAARELTSAPASVVACDPMIRNEQPGLAPDRRTAALLRSLLLLAA